MQQNANLLAALTCPAINAMAQVHCRVDFQTALYKEKGFINNPVAESLPTF